MDMIEYYSKHAIIPVGQTLPDDDFLLFKHQRQHLYSNLGISLDLLQGKNIIEFGPGPGDNARVLGTYDPKIVVLVDGNPSSQDLIIKKMTEGYLDQEIFKFHLSDARDFKISQIYDVVICEGVINGNSNPKDFLGHVSKFVKPGGHLIITTVSVWGVLDQALRRLWVPAIKNSNLTFPSQVTCASSIFKSHLKNLPTTKRIEDYVQDAILHPINKNYIFSSIDAVSELYQNFDVVGSSPRFFQDFRWHKSIINNRDEINMKFIEQFKYFSPMFLDDRMQNPLDYNLKVNENLEKLLFRVWNLSCEIFATGSYGKLDELIVLLKEVNLELKYISYDIHVGLNELIGALPNISKGIFTDEIPNFKSWWGRGLTYLSMRRI
jgi:SAM-dependent methyltransferase